MPQINYYSLPYTEIFVFDKYMISQAKEGTVLEPANNDDLRRIAEGFFKEKPFVYIANRIHEYNVNPITYIETSKIENLLGVCIISETEVGKQTALFESKFYKKDFKVASTVQEAINWAVDLVDSNGL